MGKLSIITTSPGVSDASEMCGTRKRSLAVRFLEVSNHGEHNFCCGHWFPNLGSYRRHLAEEATNGNRDHRLKLLAMGRSQCPQCKIWLPSDALTGHMRKTHGSIKLGGKASKMSSSVISSKESDKYVLNIDNASKDHMSSVKSSVISSEKNSSPSDASSATILIRNADTSLINKTVVKLSSIDNVKSALKVDKKNSCSKTTEAAHKKMLSAFKNVTVTLSNFRSSSKDLKDCTNIPVKDCLKQNLYKKSSQLSHSTMSNSEMSTEKCIKNSIKNSRKSESVLPASAKKENCVRKPYRRKSLEDKALSSKVSAGITNSQNQSETEKFKRPRGRPPGDSSKKKLASLNQSVNKENIEEDAKELLMDKDEESTEDVPIVELILFTFPSYNNHVSVFLTDPKNPNFKVYASMDAIFVGDSALGDVTNQIGYVADSNNVVYVNPGNIIFPNINELDSYKQSPVMTVLGSKLSQLLQQKPGLLSNSFNNVNVELDNKSGAQGVLVSTDSALAAEIASSLGKSYSVTTVRNDDGRASTVAPDEPSPAMQLSSGHISEFAERKTEAVDSMYISDHHIRVTSNVVCTGSSDAEKFSNSCVSDNNSIEHVPDEDISVVLQKDAINIAPTDASCENQPAISNESDVAVQINVEDSGNHESANTDRKNYVNETRSVSTVTDSLFNVVEDNVTGSFDQPFLSPIQCINDRNLVEWDSPMKEYAKEILGSPSGSKVEVESTRGLLDDDDDLVDDDLVFVRMVDESEEEVESEVHSQQDGVGSVDSSCIASGEKIVTDVGEISVCAPLTLPSDENIPISTDCLYVASEIDITTGKNDTDISIFDSRLQKSECLQSESSVHSFISGLGDLPTASNDEASCMVQEGACPSRESDSTLSDSMYDPSSHVEVGASLKVSSLEAKALDTGILMSLNESCKPRSEALVSSSVANESIRSAVVCSGQVEPTSKNSNNVSNGSAPVTYLNDGNDNYEVRDNINLGAHINHEKGEKVELDTSSIEPKISDMNSDCTFSDSEKACIGLDVGNISQNVAAELDSVENRAIVNGVVEDYMPEQSLDFGLVFNEMKNLAVFSVESAVGNVESNANGATLGVIKEEAHSVTNRESLMLLMETEGLSMEQLDEFVKDVAEDDSQNVVCDDNMASQSSLSSSCNEDIEEKEISVEEHNSCDCLSSSKALKESSSNVKSIEVSPRGSLKVESDVSSDSKDLVLKSSQSCESENFSDDKALPMNKFKKNALLMLSPPFKTSTPLTRKRQYKRRKRHTPDSSTPLITSVFPRISSKGESSLVNRRPQRQWKPSFKLMESFQVDSAKRKECRISSASQNEDVSVKSDIQESSKDISLAIYDFNSDEEPENFALRKHWRSPSTNSCITCQPHDMLSACQGISEESSDEDHIPRHGISEEEDVSVKILQEELAHSLVICDDLPEDRGASGPRTYSRKRLRDYEWEIEGVKLIGEILANDQTDNLDGEKGYSGKEGRLHGASDICGASVQYGVSLAGSKASGQPKNIVTKRAYHRAQGKSRRHKTYYKKRDIRSYFAPSPKENIPVKMNAESD